MTALELRGVCVRRGGREIVRDLHLAVGRGEWVGLIGPNGAGKTTVLNAVAGLVPARGEIAILGRAASSLGRRERARAVAYVPQAPTLPPAMRVFDYVLLGRTPHLGYLGREGRGDERRVMGVLAELGDEELAPRPLGTLSGGERQRVVIARALVQEAPIVLLDEPTSSLDVGHEQRVLGLIARLRASSRPLTVVSAMHDLTLASQFAERLVLLSGGRAVRSGLPRDVLSEEAIETHYGASVRVLVGSAGEPVAVLPRPTPPAGGTPPAQPARPAPADTASSALLYAGEQDGTASAVLGVLARAAARGVPAVVIQAGAAAGRALPLEEGACHRLGAEWWRLADGDEREPPPEERARAAWRAASEATARGRHGLVVLVGIDLALERGGIALEDVGEAIRARPAHVTLVLTAREAPAGLAELVDAATEIRPLGHARAAAAPEP